MENIFGKITYFLENINIKTNKAWGHLLNAFKNLLYVGMEWEVRINEGELNILSFNILYILATFLSALLFLPFISVCSKYTLERT